MKQFFLPTTLLRKLGFFSLLFFAILSTQRSSAQSAPSSGDIVFTEFQTDNDNIEFVTLKRLDLRNLHVTDNGILWNGTMRSGEGTYTFPNTTAWSNIPAGTFIRLTASAGTDDTDPSDGTMTVYGNGDVAKVPNFNLSSDGDQVIAYMGLPSSPAFVAGITGAGSEWNNGATNTADSKAPNTASDFEAGDRDNARFSGSVTGTSAAIRTACVNDNNWSSSNSAFTEFALKNILFNSAAYTNGTIAFSAISATGFTINAASLNFSGSSSDTRYIIVIRVGATPEDPIDRYTCYANVGTVFTSAPSVVTSVGNPPCGNAVSGVGKVIYWGYGLPSSLVVSGLTSGVNYQVKVIAVNGNGYTANMGSTGATGNQSTIATCPTNPIAGSNSPVCSGTSLNLTASATGNGLLYAWAGPNGFTSTLQNPTITYAGTAANGTYTVTISNSCGSVQASKAVVVNATPTPTFTAAPDGTICANTEQTYTTQDGKTNYVWTISGTLNSNYLITGGSTSSNTVKIKWLTTGSKTVTVNYSFNGCTGASPATSVTTVGAEATTPSIITLGSTSFCQGGFAILLSNSWVNNLWSTGSTYPFIIVSTSGSYTVTNTSGCSPATSSPVVINVYDLPAPTFVTAPGATICAGTNAVYTTQAGQTNYNWNIPGTLNTNYNIVSGSTASNTITLKWLTTGTKTVTVNYTGPGGCSGSTEASSTTTVTAGTPAPTISASGVTTFCSGGSVTLTSSLATGNVWSTGATTQSIVATTGGSYTVSNTNGCGTTTSAPVVVTVKSRPVPTFTNTAGASVCINVNATYTTQAGQTAYVWTIPGTLNTNYSIVSGSTSSNSITLKWLTTGDKTVTVNYSNGDCTGAVAATTTTTVIAGSATPVISVSGATTFCQGGSVTLTSSVATGNAWSNGATTQSIIVTASGSYAVSNNNGCTTVTSTAVVVTVNPLPVLATTSITSACGAASVNLANGITSNTVGLTVTFYSNAALTSVIAGTVTTSGTYYVKVTNANGCSSSASIVVTMLSNPVLSTTSISGACGATVNLNTGITSNTGGLTVAFYSNSTLTTSISNNVTSSGTYYVKVTNAGGCSASSSIVVTIAPAPVVTTTAINAPCNTASVNLNNGITSNTSGLTVTFYSNAGLTNVIPATVTASGTYYVKVTNANGCSSSASIVVTIQAGPALTTNNITTCTVPAVPVEKIYMDLKYFGVPNAGAVWNDIYGVSTQNLYNDHAQQTAVGLEFQTTAWNTYNQGAVTGNNSGVYPDNAIQDYYFFGIFGAPDTVSFKLTHLNPAVKYNLNLLGSSAFTGSGDNGSTVYTINGVSKVLNVQMNQQNLAMFTNLVPNADSTITVMMTKFTGAPAGYLNAMVLEKLPPAPAGIDLNTGITSSTTGLTKTFYSDAALTTVISNIVNAAGTYYVQVTNAGGCSSSAPIVVAFSAPPVLTTTSFSSVCGATSVNLNSGIVNNTTGLTITFYADAALTIPISATVTTSGTYYVKATNAGGCWSTAPITVTFAANPVLTTTSISGTCSPTAGEKIYVDIKQYGEVSAGAPWNYAYTTTTNNLVNDNNQVTTTGLEFLTSSWTSYNAGAVTGNNSGVYPDAVIKDYYYFGIYGAPETVDFRLTGLNPALKYNLTLFGSSAYTGVPDNGTTVYTINGVSQSLNVQNNQQNTVIFQNLVPDATGYIKVTMSKAVGTVAGYLNALVLEKLPGTTSSTDLNTGITSNTTGLTKVFYSDAAMTNVISNIVNASGTYYVKVTNANGCSATGSIAVNIVCGTLPFGRSTGQPITSTSLAKDAPATISTANLKVTVAKTAVTTPSKLTVYPNPVYASRYITVAAKQGLFNGKYRITLADYSGKVFSIKEMTFDNSNSFRFDLGQVLGGGKYMLIIKNTDGSSSAVVDFQNL